MIRSDPPTAQNEADMHTTRPNLSAGFLSHRKRVTVLIGAILSVFVLGATECPLIDWAELESWHRFLFPLAASLVVWLPLSHLMHWVKTGEVQGGTIALLLAVGALAVGEMQDTALILCVWTISAVLQAALLEKAYLPIRAWQALRDGTSLAMQSNEESAAGATVAVTTGEPIPCDGLLQGGAAVVNSPWDEAPAVSKEAGDPLFAGEVNLGDPITVCVQRTGDNTALSRAIALGQQALLSTNTGGGRRLRTVFCRWSVCWATAALAVVIVMPLLYGAAARRALTRGVSLLALTIPGAWSAAAMLPVAALTGAALRRSIIPTRTGVWSQLSRLGLLAVAREATLAGNSGLVVDVLPVNTDACTPAELLAIAAAVETACVSEHIVGLAIRRAAKKEGIAVPLARAGREKPGRGAFATIDGHRCLVGSADYMRENGIDIEASDGLVSRVMANECMPVFCAAGGHLLGVLGVTEGMRQEWPRMVSSLRALGIRLLVLRGGGTERQRTAWIPGDGGWEVGLLSRQELATLRSWVGTSATIGVVGRAERDDDMLQGADVGMVLGPSGLLGGTAHLLLPRGNLEDIPWVIAQAKRMRRRTVFAAIAAISLRLVLAFLVIAGDMDAVGVVVVDSALCALIVGMSFRLL